MKKTTQTHYFVQVEVEGGFPQTIAHTYDKEQDVYYNEFLNRKQAVDLMEAEKLASPTEKFRIVKCTTTYTPTEWK